MHYNRALDGVRALSILAVVFFSLSGSMGDGGYIGVDVFFVLSGYLITALLTAEHHKDGGINIGGFYVRRALRLYPTLLIVLLAYVALAPVLWPTDERWLVVALNALYVVDYSLVLVGVPANIAHTWSLGVEEKFYLLWPLLLPLLLRTRRPIAWLLAAFIVVTAWRYVVALKWGWAHAYFRFDTRTSGILLGAIAALMPLKVSRPAVLIACFALAVTATVPIIETSITGISIEGVTLGITLAELSAFLLIRYVADHENQRFLASAPMAYLGRLSYGIYLWHFPFVLVLRMYSQPWWIMLPATVLFSFAMAAICLHLVDMPIKRWREKARSLSAAIPALRAET